MALTTIDRPPTDENLAACGWTGRKGQLVTLEGGSRQRNGSYQRKLYRDKSGRPFVRDRFKVRRFIEACRFLVIDGVPMQSGSVVLCPPHGIPRSHPVQPIERGTLAYQEARDVVTCGTCGRSWDDGQPTGWTPAPAGRCPFEAWH